MNERTDLHTKTCSVCLITFNINQFYCRKNGRYEYCCKFCSSNINKIYRNSKKERCIFLDAKKRAVKKNLQFSITETDIKIPSHCSVFGFPLELQNSNQAYNSPSIDRFDNEIGYTPENIRIISWKANNLKSNGTVVDFENLYRYFSNSKDLYLEYYSDSLKQKKLRRRFSKIKAECFERGLSFTLDQSNIDAICKNIPVKCPILGIELSFDNSKQSDNSISVDRINNAFGYEANNILLCSWKANRLKRDSSIEEFEKILRYMKNGN